MSIIHVTCTVFYTKQYLCRYWQMIHLISRWYKHTMLANTVNVYPLPYDCLNNIFLSLAYLIVRIEYTMHIPYNIFVNQLFMLSVRFPVYSRLLVKILGSQNYTRIFDCMVVGAPNTPIVQGSTVFPFLYLWGYMHQL